MSKFFYNLIFTVFISISFLIVSQPSYAAGGSREAAAAPETEGTTITRKLSKKGSIHRTADGNREAGSDGAIIRYLSNTTPAIVTGRLYDFQIPEITDKIRRVGMTLDDKEDFIRDVLLFITDDMSETARLFVLDALYKPTYRGSTREMSIGNRKRLIAQVLRLMPEGNADKMNSKTRLQILSALLQSSRETSVTDQALRFRDAMGDKALEMKDEDLARIVIAVADSLGSKERLVDDALSAIKDDMSIEDRIKILEDLAEDKAPLPGTRVHKL
jgi:DNA-binding transcriptional ArsR family regulator